MSVTLALKLHKNGELVYSYTFAKKTRLLATFTANKKLEWDAGTVRVWYNREQDYWNEFNFGTVAELKRSLGPCLEPSLVQEFA